MNQNDELLNDFIVEASENLQSASDCLSTLIIDQRNKEALNSIYRCIHTLKGSASLLNFIKTQEVAHLVESYLDLIREERIELNPKALESLEKYFDELNENLKKIEKNRSETDTKFEAKLNFLDLMEKALCSNTIHDSSFLFPEDRTQEGDLENEDNNMLKDHVGIDVDSNIEIKKNDEDIATKSIIDTSIRVHVQILDKIIDTVGELVLKRNQILQFANHHGNNDLYKLTQDLNIITSELQNDIMATRMQPVGNVIGKFDRLVRDHSRETGKKIKLKLLGQDTELDRSLLESIRDPLTHIVRNCIDHGIEMPQVREKKGKDGEGSVLIRAYHESGQVTIEIQDDGQGLSKSKIIAKAIDKKFIESHQVSELSDDEIFQLTFLPGFSTADSVTKVSGRGVGMDVVKTNVEKIGGSVFLTSIEEKGTTIKLKIPLTLAIVPALIVKSFSEVFAFPQLNVEEIVLNADSDQLKKEMIMDFEFIRLRDELIPIYILNDELKLSDIAIRKKTMQKAFDEESQSGVTTEIEQNRFIVILNADSKRFGIIVDEILDTEEIVVKPLSRSLANLGYFAGSTIMGNGSVALIIDAISFLTKVAQLNEGHDQLRKKEDVVESVNTEVHENLLIRLHDDQIYAVPLSLISRLERVDKERLEKVGDSFVIRYQGRPMVLIELSKKLGLVKGSVLTKEIQDHVMTLVFENHQMLYGLVVKEIVDISLTTDVVDSHVVDRKGFMGTLYIDGQIVTMLDLYQIISKEIENNSTCDAKILQLNFKNKRLLLNEDSPVYRKMESDLFRELGFDVLTATNGKEGFDLLMKHKDTIDIVITDIEMPIMNGFDFCQEVRKDPHFSDLPIIAVSTKVTDKDREMGKKVGFNQHLEKFKRDQVIDIISSYFT
jgi:two-component system, chemotaxis family, sensor kinase CheA